LLQGLAEVGDGIYSYVEDEDMIGQAFGEALGGLLTTSHQNVVLSMEVASDVRISDVHTVYPVKRRGDIVEVVLGDLFAEERRDVLVAVQVDAGQVSSLQSLMSIRAKGFCVSPPRTDETCALKITLGRCAETEAAKVGHPHVLRHRNRHIAMKALENARAVADGDLAEARKILTAAIETLSESSVTVGGDALSLGLLTDLRECLRDMQRREDYRSCGSKKMASMQGAHGKQRVCYGQSFSHHYANASMRSYGEAGKTACG